MAQPPRLRRPIPALLVASLVLAGIVVATEQRPAAAAVTSVKGWACGYISDVGLFGGPKSKLGCAPQAGTPSAPATTDTLSPSVSLPSSGSATPMTVTDSNGASARYGPATIFGGRWPDQAAAAPPSGPITVSAQGTPAGGTVTASADITLYPAPVVVACSTGYTPPCTVPGGFGPFPVEGDSVHVECTATETSVSGSTTFTNAELATSTDGDGSPVEIERVPDNPPVNYTRHGVITNVGDVFTVVYNEQIVNSDGSLTVNGAHMYLFGPTAVGEVIKGQVTCGTTPTTVVANDTRRPTCGRPVVMPMGPEDPTPQVPRQELVGVFDAGKGPGTGLQSITNVTATNATVRVGDPSGFPYLQFTPGQTGPLVIKATRNNESQPMRWAFTATDAAGNSVRCRGLESRTVADFDGDTDTDVSVFRPGSGGWFSASGMATTYGTAGDVAVPADYDGDGRTDNAIVRPSLGLWSIRRSATNTDTFLTYGVSSDIPVPGDYDGDARADVAIFRPSLSTWYIRNSATNTDTIVTFGLPSDIPVVGDYDGDGRTDLAVFRPSSGGWFVQKSSGGSTATPYGTSGDIPVPGDYDGDGLADTAIFRPSTGGWSVRQSSSGADFILTYGVGSDQVQPGDYDADGRTDVAIFRSSLSTWFVRRSSSGFDSIATFGLPSDVPLPLPHAIRRSFY